MYSRLAGYEDVNDAERLSQDPAFRLIGSEKVLERGAALTSRLRSFQTQLLTQPENLAGPARISRDLIAKAEVIDAAHRVVLDMDSTEIPFTAGRSKAPTTDTSSPPVPSAAVVQPRRRLPAATLRPGNVHSAEGWEELLLPEIERQQRRGKEVVFRADAAFAKARDLPGAGTTESEVHHPPSGQRQPGAQGCALAEAASGKAELQAGGLVQELLLSGGQLEVRTASSGEGRVHFRELFPRVGFVVTNFRTSSRTVVRFYNKRGTAEQWIKEGKQAVAMTRLGCHRFRANQVRLWLSVIAYNLGNLWRRLALPAGIANWSLTSLQQRLVKTGGRLIKHARYYWLLLAESHLTRRLFGGMLRRIVTLPSPAG